MIVRETCVRAARVYLAEVRARRDKHRGFAFLLLDWAANARKRAGMETMQREMQL